MNRLFLLILTLMLLGCQTQPINPMTGMADKVFELPSYDQRVPSLSLAEIEKEIKKLNSVIGGYPPKFTSTQHRDMTYVTWANLLQETLAYQTTEDGTEQILYLLSELYRQGHNLDVRHSAENAKKSIDECLGVNNHSVPCNFSAVYFYLSVNPKYADKAEKSLSFLRGHYAPKPNHEVERAYVTLYIFKQDAVAAREQIDYFIQTFPDSPDREIFEKIRSGLDDGEIKKHQI
ncbi:MAG: hypothetical protein PVI97_18795 [Candidatus Thiodiazotropha sp.]